MYAIRSYYGTVRQDPKTPVGDGGMAAGTYTAILYSSVITSYSIHYTKLYEDHINFIPQALHILAADGIGFDLLFYRFLF